MQRSKYRPSTDQVPTKLDKPITNVIVLVQAIGKKQVKFEEMMETIGLKHRQTFRVNYLAPAIEAGFVTLLYPDSPRHPRQRYLLTPKGIMLLNANISDNNT